MQIPKVDKYDISGGMQREHLPGVRTGCELDGALLRRAVTTTAPTGRSIVYFVKAKSKSS